MMFKRGKLLVFLSLMLIVSISFSYAETWKYNYLPIDDISDTSTTFYPANFKTLIGTNTSDNVTYVKYDYDNLIINVSETTGSPALDVRINFTSVSSFNNVLMREQYLTNLAHDMDFQIWNYDSSSWDTHFSFSSQGALVTENIYITDSENHVSNGLVQTRFYHLDNGNINDKMIIDSVQLLKGTTSITTNEHDSLSGRDSESNHPWAYPASNPDGFISDYTETDPVCMAQLPNYYNRTSDLDLGEYKLRIESYGSPLEIFSEYGLSYLKTSYDGIIYYLFGEEGLGYVLQYNVFSPSISSNGLVNLGASDAKWKNLFLAGTAYGNRSNFTYYDNINATGKNITANIGTFNNIDNQTTTASKYFNTTQLNNGTWIKQNTNANLTNLNITQNLTASKYCNATICKDLSQWGGSSSEQDYIPIATGGQLKVDVINYTLTPDDYADLEITTSYTPLGDIVDVKGTYYYGTGDGIVDAISSMSYPARWVNDSGTIYLYQAWDYYADLELTPYDNFVFVVWYR